MKGWTTPPAGCARSAGRRGRVGAHCNRRPTSGHALACGNLKILGNSRLCNIIYFCAPIYLALDGFLIPPIPHPNTPQELQLASHFCEVIFRLAHSESG